MPAFRKLLIVSAALLLGGCVTSDISTGTVLNGVTVVDTRTGALSSDMAVVVDKGSIVKVARAGSVRATGSATVVDATGKYVVPGYLNMHAHVVEASDMPVTYFPLLIANGITGFRQMSGNPAMLTRGQRLRQEIAAGTVVAPEPLMLVGRLLNTMPDFFGPGMATPELVVQEVRAQKQTGADFIKVINVNPEVFQATVEEARRQGLGVGGHLTPAISGTQASNIGMRVYEHLGGTLGNVLYDCSTDEAAVRQGLVGGARRPMGPPPTAETIQLFLATPTITVQQTEAQFMQRGIDTYSEERCRALARTLVRNETWQALTMIRLKSMLMPDAPEFQNNPNLKYVSPQIRGVWQRAFGAYSRQPAEWKTTYKQLYEHDLKMVRIFKEEGVKILAGDDFGGGWVVAGFGLHQEFRELAAAGLTPLEVLQATTLNGAEFMGRTATMGTVEQGKVADLVVLDANPLSGVENLSRISGVMLRGRYFNKAALDKMKDDVEAAYRN